MAQAKLLNVSSSPHVRSKLSTGHVMYDVLIGLMPATFVGVFHFGYHALFIILVSILSAVCTEYLFDHIVKKDVTIQDGSAIVTGLLLALCLPSTVPLYIPIMGSVFAILIVKCFFGGLGKNFMNPALAGRCFLLISFGTSMTQYAYDGVTGATPLATLASGGTASPLAIFLGSTAGVIGNCTLALLIGGLYLWVVNGITWQIPVSTLVMFTLFLGAFGGHGFNPSWIAAEIAGGGIIMAAFFMATDPVTSPVTGTGQIVFGALVGLLAGLFRVFGASADSVSYAVIFANLITPLIDKFIIPKPYAYRKGADQDKYLSKLQAAAGEPALGESVDSEGIVRQKKAIPLPVIVIGIIAIVSGVLLSTVYDITKDKIAEQEIARKAESYELVLPEATQFSSDEALTAAIEALGGETYGTTFGNVTINEAVDGADDSGNLVGTVISVTSKDGYDGAITLSVGIKTDGTLGGIAFTSINETAGMGMRADEPEFKDQFTGRTAQQFTLNKAGNASSDSEINSVSGASVTSSAVLNAVNAAIDFYQANSQ